MTVCVALPARVAWVGNRTATSVPGRVSLGDAVREVELLLVPGVEVGDRVIVHSGYAIAIVPEDAAAESLALLGYDH